MSQREAAGATGRLELLAMGRADVDLYAEQDGARLEEADSFAKYVGGSALNTAVGLARLGVRTGMLTGVGDEAMGRFVRSTLEAEGVDTTAVRTVPGKLTSLVLLAVRETDGFPRIFFAEDGADLSLEPDDVDEGVVARAGAVLVGGTYLSRPGLAAAVDRVVTLARAGGARIVLDIDYRPVLWGAVGPDGGTLDAVPSTAATDAIQALLPRCDLVVGTEAELRIAGGSEDLSRALERIRELSAAVLVVKRGASGSVVLDGPIPTDLDGAGVRAPGFAVDVVNAAGAGDGFLAGFLSGWLRGSALEACAVRGNAVGALVIARRGCAPAMPTAPELEAFLARSIPPRRPAEDHRLGQLHRLAGRATSPSSLYVLAFDHRWQLEQLADRLGASRSRLPILKELIWRGFSSVAGGRGDVGVLVDDRYGERVLELASGSGWFVARALDEPASRPLRVLGEPDLASFLHSWPRDHVIKVLAYLGLDDPAGQFAAQVATLTRVQEACRRTERELLVELQAPPGERYGEGELPEVVERLLGAGLEPEWWKLPPSPHPADWARLAGAVEASDIACRGLLVLGQGSTEEQLHAAFTAAAGQPLCRGFAVGRTIFEAPAGAWLAGELDDEALSGRVGDRFVETIDRFGAARAAARATAEQGSAAGVRRTG